VPTLAKLAAASLLALLPAIAGAQAPDVASACAACHGPNGNSQNPQFPSIAGQPRVFLENQLVLIREGLRDVPAMKDIMAGMKDETIIELAKHFSAKEPTPKTGAVKQDVYARGEQLAQQNLCGTCHLADYAGQNQVPRLAWQQEAFLVESMKQFRDNPTSGRDTIMAATLRGMSDTDLAQLAHYLANFKP
jgi:cytochrome c553